MNEMMLTHSGDRSSSPNYHSLLYGADAKKSQSKRNFPNVVEERLNGGINAPGPTLSLSRPGEHQSATNGEMAAVDNAATPVSQSSNGAAAAGDANTTTTASSVTPASSGDSTVQ